MVARVRMTSAGQVTLPAEVRRQLQVEGGAEFVVEVRDGALVELRPSRGSLADLAGSIKSRRSASLAEIEDAIRQGPTG